MSVGLFTWVFFLFNKEELHKSKVDNNNMQSIFRLDLRRNEQF